MTKRKATSISNDPSGAPEQHESVADRHVDALTAKVTDSLDTGALAAKFAAPVGVAVAQRIGLDVLRDRVVDVSSIRIAQDDEFLDVLVRELQAEDLGDPAHDAEEAPVNMPQELQNMAMEMPMSIMTSAKMRTATACFT